MKDAAKFMMASALTSFVLCGTVAANAQAPGAQPGAPGAAGRGQGRIGGQGRGGFGGGNMTMGTITGGDMNAGLITVASQFGGGVTTIRVSPNTQIMSQVTISVSDLKVNDQVQVQGVPSGITASSIAAGEMPAFLQGGGRNRGNQPNGANGAPGANPNGQPPNGQPNQANTPPQPQAFATATGKVVSKSPLTISLGNDVTITLKLAQNAKITKLMPVTIASLKVGDTVMAAGQTEADGSFTATGVGVNLNTRGGGFGGFGGGGFGGRGGFAPGAGGQGGPGGPGANGGGFGGRRGNRGNRGGGGANGQGGAGAPPNQNN